MAKSNTNITGMHIKFRPLKDNDTFRVQIHAKKQGSTVRETFFIADKVDRDLKEINRYLKVKKLREADAEKDPDFIRMRDRLIQKLKDEYGLKEYRSRELAEIKKKEFDFDSSVIAFFEHKKGRVSVAHAYCSHVQIFWLPFFFSKGCVHPREFVKWEHAAEDHLVNAEKIKGGKYSPNSYRSMCAALNEYIKFLHRVGHIESKESFKIYASETLEQRKRASTRTSGPEFDTYSLKELKGMKPLFDRYFADDPKQKLSAYKIFFGICLGLRRGNILGLKSESFFLNAKPAYIETRDNIISAWSRGESGTTVIKDAGKYHVGRKRLPLLLPSKKILIEIASYISENTNPKDHFFSCYPDTIGDIWQNICEQIGIKYITPLEWRHTFATVGAKNLHKFFKGNVMLLKECCLHRKVETTIRYVEQDSADFFADL